MSISLLKNQNHIKICARYEFIKNERSLEKAYYNFCDRLGNEAMIYKDFEFLWSRFENGDLNLDFDQKRPVTADFIDFPDNVIGEIIDKLDYSSRSRLRKVSKKYRRAVDNIPFFIKELEFNDLEGSYSLKIDAEIMNFDNNSKAITELINAFHSPNVNIGKLSILADERHILSRLPQYLVKMRQKIELKSIRFKFSNRRYHSWGFNLRSIRELMNPSEEIAKILMHFEPGVLENIEFEARYMKIGEISKLAQWKQAKRIKANFYVAITKFMHFVNVDIEMQLFSVEDIMKLRDIYKNMKGFEQCTIKANFYNDLSTIQTSLGAEKYPFVDAPIQFEVDWRNLVIKKTS